MDALVRHWHLLRMIPRHPSRISTDDIKRRLENLRHYTTLRTIQRDLVKLSGIFPLFCDDHRPAGWSWRREGEMMHLPPMDQMTALSFKMVQDFLTRLLPPACVTSLAPHFAEADRVLTREAAGALPAWPRKVTMVQRAMPLRKPAIEETVLNAVYDALFRGKRLTGVYGSRSGGGTHEVLLNPLGLIFADPVVYLAATDEEKEPLAVRTYALHRLKKAEVTNQVARKVPGFALRPFALSGHLGVKRGEAKLSLHALFDGATAQHLAETPVSADQALAPQPNGRVLLTASVEDTNQLRWWLLGFGDRVEVLEPGALRAELGEQLARAAMRYQS